ncbi:uncharacterized protein SEPMUDRAFT_165455 [Sphaerulina musiva SO2202]|uniref:Uncharacterized protein n=1 Tax=Sphaerulina musiva (strain SO2202) TaxID=692275 RepID=N1QEM3_SPHMS|nr:uncharacterized protein SEPMUDRAFT_165455 [Sphaerulina musiva SO2202]EMF10870.1 hypothetical protein SEPMUDRAFT_165455 [Sphaerulina musiva SO2202]
MPYATPEDLDKFDPQRAGRYDPGEIQVFYDNRTFGGFEDKMPLYQKYKLQALSRLGRPDIWSITDLPGGHLRIIFFTHVGAQGQKDFPIHKWVAVKEMFDSLSEEGFRPYIIGYSNENPFPMLGGVEPEQPKVKAKAPKVAKTWSNYASGHSDAKGVTPHDRVMAIIRDDDEKEAKLRELQIREWTDEKKGGYGEQEKLV